MSDQPNRREFLCACTAVAAAGIVGASLRPSPALAQKGGETWVAILGKIKDLNEQEPQLVKAQFMDQDGRVMDEDKLYVRYEKRGNTGKWIILSAICTHLKCKLDYQEAESIFVCPCHGSRYELDGTVIKKPSKKDLPDYSDDAYEDGEWLKLKRAAS